MSTSLFAKGKVLEISSPERKSTNRQALHFSFVRILMGLYCALFFFFLKGRAKDLFSNQGIFSDPTTHVTYGYFPSILHVFSSPAFCEWLCVALSILGLCLVLGIFRRISAFLIWYGLCSLWNQNEHFWSPALPFVGWQLLAYSFIPLGEPLCLLKSKQQKNWTIPPGFIKIAWLTLGLAYTISGMYKFISPSWYDGTAIRQIMNWTWARDWLYVDLLLALPDWCLNFLTWFTVASEALFLPLIFFPQGRFIAWLCMTLIQVNLTFIVDLFDLTFGVLLFHLFVFDYAWVDELRGFFRRKRE